MTEPIQIPDDNLKSPNNSVYKTLLHASATVDDGFIAVTYLLTGTEAISGSGGVLITGASGLGPLPHLIYFDDADYTVGSLTQKLRLRAQISVNATAWSSVTGTFGLYPVTFAGGADALTITAGTVVSGSTVPIANPSASTTNQGNSGDFTVPSDGAYAIGIALSAQVTTNSCALLTAQLQTRNV